MYRTREDGTIIWLPPAEPDHEKAPEADLPPAEKVTRRLVAAARSARAENRAFLALTPAEQRTHAPAQVVALTQQVQGLIRLVLSDLDEDEGQ